MRKVKKAYEITDAKISFVSLVDRAANLRKFLITKQKDGKASFTTCGKIVKADAEKHYVTGIVYEPLTEDSQGNYMTEDEITKACYWFSENGDQIDLQHSFEPLEGATVVENWVAKADFMIGDEKIRKGTWLMTVKVNDGDVWRGIESGEITGFSMGGVGNYSEEDVALNSVAKTGERKGLLKQLGATLGFHVVEKGTVAELYEERSKGERFWAAFEALEDALRGVDPVTGRLVYLVDEARIRECLADFNGIITEILTGSEEGIAKAIHIDRPVEKAGKALSGKNRETLQGIYESLGGFLASFQEEPDEPGEEEVKKEESDMTKQEVEQIVDAAIEKALRGTEPNTVTFEATKAENNELQEMVTAAVEKALAAQTPSVTEEQVQKMVSSAVEKAMEPLLKSRGLPSNLNGSETVEKSAGGTHYLHGIL